MRLRIARWPNDGARVLDGDLTEEAGFLESNRLTRRARKSQREARRRQRPDP